jgi:3-oxoacyl-[acyl-carrier protein] reductase
LTNRVALITGASRGIGRAIAIQLAQDGFDIVVNYHKNEAAAQKVVDEITELGGSAMALQADVSQADQASNLIEETVKAMGRLDVLVNNAGIAHDQLLVRLNLQDWERMINTNLSSVFYCCQVAVKPMMKQRFGKIINISSIVGITGNIGQAHYAAAKSGVIGLTRSIASEYGKRGITANVIAPGFIDTDMTKEMSYQHQQKIMERIVLGRLGTPEDVAGAASFLASSRADYITGQVIRVDGGMSSL